MRKELDPKVAVAVVAVAVVALLGFFFVRSNARGGGENKQGQQAGRNMMEYMKASQGGGTNQNFDPRTFRPDAAPANAAGR